MTEKIETKVRASAHRLVATALEGEDLCESHDEILAVCNALLSTEPSDEIERDARALAAVAASGGELCDAHFEVLTVCEALLDKDRQQEGA